ncbi:hypothetical protein AGMMS49928_17390 [Spirochaetia bacterium]|nr:hypothetical protein AGMMS49928_17390 [Spirochaetia bacterium]
MELTISPETYKNYLEDNDTFSNERIRPDGESFWDAMLSKEADFTQYPEGKQIVELIKAL